MSNPVVGQTLTTLQLTSLPSGTRVERAVDGWVVTEVPPQVSERDQLAEELHTYMDQYRLDNGYDEHWEHVLADYILGNYVRKAPEPPVAVTVDHGCRWERQPDGTYTIREYSGDLSRSHAHFRLEVVREKYGPLRDAA